MRKWSVRVAVLSAAPGVTAAAAAPLQTQGGLVRGTTAGDGGIRVFKGIPYAAPPVANVLTAQFGDVAELVGWSLEGNRLRLAWKALSTPDTRYTVFVHVRDAAGALASQRDAPPGGGFQDFCTEVRSAQSPAGTGVAPALRPPSLCRFSS